MLAQRLAAERGARPVALVWTKSDYPIAPEMEQAVRDAVFRPMPDAKEFHVSIVAEAGGTKDTGQGLLELLDWSLDVRRELTQLPAPTVASADPLFIFGCRA